MLRTVRTYEPCLSLDGVGWFTEKSGKCTIAVAGAASADLTGPSVQCKVWLAHFVLVGFQGFGCELGVLLVGSQVRVRAFLSNASLTKPLKRSVLAGECCTVVLSCTPHTLFHTVVGSELPRTPAPQPLSPAGARSYNSMC